jgi:hypothetical protein
MDKAEVITTYEVDLFIVKSLKLAVCILFSQLDPLRFGPVTDPVKFRV